MSSEFCGICGINFGEKGEHLFTCSQCQTSFHKECLAWIFEGDKYKKTICLKCNKSLDITEINQILNKDEFNSYIENQCDVIYRTYAATYHRDVNMYLKNRVDFKTFNFNFKHWSNLLTFYETFDMNRSNHLYYIRYALNRGIFQCLLFMKYISENDMTNANIRYALIYDYIGMMSEKKIYNFVRNRNIITNEYYTIPFVDVLMFNKISGTILYEVSETRGENDNEIKPRNVFNREMINRLYESIQGLNVYYTDMLSNVNEFYTTQEDASVKEFIKNDELINIKQILRQKKSFHLKISQRDLIYLYDKIRETAAFIWSNYVRIMFPENRIESVFETTPFYACKVLLKTYGDMNVRENFIEFYRRSHEDVATLKNNEPKRDTLCSCQVNDCVGVVSRSEGEDTYKCNVCLMSHCPNCGVSCIDLLEHICDESTVESFSYIKATTKACPSCGTRVTKTSGCNQMFCTFCHNGFDYSTGEIIKGNFHNPHRAEWLQKIRDKIDINVQCGNNSQYNFIDADETLTNYNHYINYLNSLLNERNRVRLRFYDNERRRLLTWEAYETAKYMIKFVVYTLKRDIRLDKLKTTYTRNMFVLRLLRDDTDAFIEASRSVLNYVRGLMDWKQFNNERANIIALLKELYEKYDSRIKELYRILGPNDVLTIINDVKYVYKVEF